MSFFVNNKEDPGLKAHTYFQSNVNKMILDRLMLMYNGKKNSRQGVGKQLAVTNDQNLINFGTAKQYVKRQINY